MNEAMKIERENFLNAGAYERSKNRLDYANGFKPKTFNTRSGLVTFAIPQTRNSGFYPKALQKGLRSEMALTIAMAKMLDEEIRLFKERPLGCYSVLYVDAEHLLPRQQGRCVNSLARRAGE